MLSLHMPHIAKETTTPNNNHHNATRKRAEKATMPINEGHEVNTWFN